MPGVHDRRGRRPRLRRVRALARALPRGDDSDPRLWGLHNYGDVTYGRTTGTDAVLAAVPGELWIEETGGIVTLRGAGGRVAMPTNETRAAASIRRAFALAAARPRIGRMYVYHWRAAAGAAFDAGLVRAGRVGAPRASTALAELLRPAAVAERWRARWAKGRLVLRVTCRAAAAASR